MYLAAGAPFSVKMTAQDLTIPVAAIKFVAGAFRSAKMTTQDLTSPVAAMIAYPAGHKRFFAEHGQQGFVQA